RDLTVTGVQTCALPISLVNADPLLTALGRSNREQVVTERPKLATTLEALELTNGRTLSAVLKRGAARWLAKGPKSTDELVTRLRSEERRVGKGGRAGWG